MVDYTPKGKKQAMYWRATMEDLLLKVCVGITLAAMLLMTIESTYFAQKIKC